MLKIISLNANGIRSAARKGFFTWLEQQNADFICIQETKAQYEQLAPHELYFPESYYCEYSDAEKKGYSGVAIYAKQKPLQIINKLNFATCDQEGRYLQFDYPKFSVISIYLPSGTSGEARQEVKYDFLNRLTPHLQNLKNQGRELIICGDYNIAHKQIDLKNWQGNQKNSGFLPEERAWMDNLFDNLGFIDAFRVKNQAADQYTWWSNRGQAWLKNVGWRIDYQIVTPTIAANVADVDIYLQTRFSDHAPLIISYDGNWYD
jgi:exodeoxyribonuclease III